MELHALSIARLSGLIAARKLSPVELLDALIRRVEDYDAQTRAFITPTFEPARRQASDAEAEIAAGRYRGPLHGVPFGLKDIYDTRGILTSGHSRVFIDRIPREDATTVSKLYEAGAVLLGKLATHEMAHAGPSFDLPWPPARNPWSLERFTGGSSSGSGAAVAAGMVPVALGSDTGGSIRGPASLCGVVGLMPTFGLVSRAGVITNSYTFDHCGPLARTVDDCAALLEALAGYDPKDAGSLSRPIPRYRRALGQDLRGIKIGVLRHHWEEDIPASEDVCRAMDAALDARFDAFVTAGMGEAPRLSDYRSVSFWQKPSLLTAWNVTGQPVLALPNGFGRNGLPLGMQIVGRPFGETTILRVGHAYERATEWHTRRPQLVQGATAPDVTPPPVLSELADRVDAETRDLCVKAARRAGLLLDDLMLAQLLEGAPYALSMVQRLRRDHDPHHEPANVFSFPPSRAPEV